ncbi:CRISPR-associated endonuclease Cas2 [Salimicrobium sp. PL1-032A]|uniref:CRISPR-associated endonuclease Cas2 n=1 Tax=Salimicrobium sp. PL1-032A TaxID=3095364 RepID=UPI0032618623
MRVFIMFDLPVETKTQVRTYNKFRKSLIEEGFLMMQYSIYVKSCLNKESAESMVHKVKMHLPKDGHVRSLIITERQFESMKILIGEEDKNLEILGDNRTIQF